MPIFFWDVSLFLFGIFFCSSCFLLLAFCFPLSAFAVFASCFLLSIASAFCLLLLASCVLLSVFSFCFLLFAFCFYVFWTESKNGCNKTIAIPTATITVTLTKDSHYSNFYRIFIVANSITGAIITTSFPVTNERTSRNNKRASKRKKRQTNIKEKINA